MPMATTEAYLTFLLHQLEGISEISSKKMFGGVSALLQWKAGFDRVR